MEYFAKLRDFFDGYETYEFCDVCDDEIGPDDPAYIEPDGDNRDDGTPYDCSTYLCAACGDGK